MRKFSKESRDVKASDGDDLAAPADTDHDTSANDTVDQFDFIAGHDFDENEVRFGDHFSISRLRRR